MSARALLYLALPCLLAAGSGAQGPSVVLLAGATGKTGILTYAELKKVPGLSVRALVRNATKARDQLGCDKCDESEGVFVGDVTKPESLAAAVQGVDVLVSTLGSNDVHCKFGPIGCKYPPGAAPKDINWLGNRALATAAAKAGARQVVLMSTMGTTAPDNFLDKLGGGFVSFYSLQAEAWLLGTGLNYTIVKPCGLSDGEASKHKLLVGHDDQGFSMMLNHAIARADVARVLAAAVASPATTSGLRFDLCSAALGEPTLDVREVFAKAMYPWDPRSKREDSSRLVVV